MNKKLDVSFLLRNTKETDINGQASICDLFSLGCYLLVTAGENSIKRIAGRKMCRTALFSLKNLSNSKLIRIMKKVDMLGKNKKMDCKILPELLQGVPHCEINNLFEKEGIKIK